MKKEVKKLWLEALRSGEYKQGKDQLKDGHKYCCLGVLCDLYRKENDKGFWNEETFRSGSFDKYTLTNEVVEWAELKEDNPKLKLDDNSRKLSISFLNDDGIPFTEIADLIEKQL